MKNKLIALLLLLVGLAFILIGCGIPERTAQIAEAGRYSKPDEVAQYINMYEHLPDNYLTKKEAVERGWVSNKGNLWEVTDRMSIGGDVFGNREVLLPTAKGRIWYECDVNYYGGFRGGERLVYSNDGLIYYTGDHYKTFTQIQFPGRT